MRVLIALSLIAVVSAVPENAERIMGGSASTVGEYPYMANMQYEWAGWFYYQYCGGILITRTSILSAATCFRDSAAYEWRARLGSSFTSSGGVIHYASRLIINAHYNAATFDSDVAIVRLEKPVTLGNGIQVATLAGPGYSLNNDADVTAVGWGSTTTSGSYPEQVRHVHIKVMDQELCASLYTRKVTENMLCAGEWMDRKGACLYDEGGPLVHKGVVVGLTSWAVGRSYCGSPGHPGVYVRISKFAELIQDNTNGEIVSSIVTN